MKLHVKPLQLDVNAAVGGWFVTVAGFKASAVASHEWGDVKYQFQWGSAVPPLAKTAYSPSALMALSDTLVMLVKPAGGSVPTTPSDIVTA